MVPGEERPGGGRMMAAQTLGVPGNVVEQGSLGVDVCGVHPRLQDRHQTHGGDSSTPGT